VLSLLMKKMKWSMIMEDKEQTQTSSEISEGK